MKKMFNLVFSIEFFFAAFLLAGYFKGAFPWVPIDITLVCLGITGLLCVRRIIKLKKINKNSWIAIIIYAMLSVIIFLSFVNSDSVIYAREKFIRFSIITSWSFLGVFIIIKDKESLIKFFKSIIVISFLVALAGFKTLVQNLISGTYVGTIFVMDTDYLALGRTVGLGLIVLIGCVFFSKEKVKLIHKLMAIIMAMVLFGAGGKMPLISTIITLFLLFILSIKYDKRNKVIKYSKGVKLLFGFFTIGICIVIGIALSGKMDDFFWRLQSLFAGQDESTLMRVVLYKTAIEMIKVNPLIGVGWATFPLYYYGMDKKVYPHNILLEVFSELGVIGFITLLALIVFAAYCGFKRYKEKHTKYNNLQLAIIGGFAFFLLNSMSSGDITDNKILFTFIALLVKSVYINKLDDTEENINNLKLKKRKKIKLVW